MRRSQILEIVFLALLVAAVFIGALVTGLAFPVDAWGDAGGFAGSSSYGGGGGMGGYGGGGYSGGGYGGGYYGGSNWDPTIVIICIIILVVLFLLGNRKKGGGMNSPRSSNNQPAGASVTPDSQLRSFSELIRPRICVPMTPLISVFCSSV